MRIKATKMDGCGNSFLVIDEMRTPLDDFDRVQISALMANQHDTDGVLYLDQLNGVPAMKIFDRDGTEETMCGNGLRCATRYFRDHYVADDTFTIMTGDGAKNVVVEQEMVEVNLGEARDYKEIDHKLHYVFTGVPHIVVISPEMSLESVRALGKSLREEKALCEYVGHSDGVNVNFIWRTNDGISVRTFEMGVEDVTQSCGTGSAASAYVASKVFGVTLPIQTNSLGGGLRIREDSGGLAICGPTRYQGKVIGFINAMHPKPIMPIQWQRNLAWQGM